jgi:monoterpene epsilon-lactone hydrolase
MTLSLRSRFWRMLLRTTFKEQRLTIAEERARAAKNARFMSRIPKGVKVEKIDIDGIRAAWIYPSNSEGEKVVLHLHGGGYVVGGIDSYQMMCGLMAQTLKTKILLPEYRLAPENPFPAAVDDALKIYRWLLVQGYQPGNIVISGDSAGGGLSIAAALSLRDAGDPLPAAIVCISPWADLTFKGPSHVNKAEAEALLTTGVLREWASCYVGKEDPENPLISPIYADFTNFPPLLIQVGSEEILLDDARMLVEKAKTDGVEVWNGMWHVWHVLGNLIPESRQAFEEMRQFTQDHMAQSRDMGEM